jgi:twinkle protein
MAGQQSGLPCVKCESSDALTIYPKGDGFCFSCNTHFFPDQIEAGEVGNSEALPWEDDAPPAVVNSRPESLGPADLPERGLTKASLEYYGVGVEFSEANGEAEAVSFPVYREGELTGYKVKTLATKQFIARGSTKSPDLFGQHKVGEGGKLLIITEGEEDCMAAYQMLRSVGKSYNVVSLPTGANLSAVRKNIEWLETFETVTLNLDCDPTGTSCAKEIGDLLTPGKVKIMSLPVKDANDYLRSKHSANDYLKAVWNAKPYRPDGVVAMKDSWEAMFADDQVKSILYPWDGLNKKLYGMRQREIVTWTAGTGVGKSAIVRELEHHLLMKTEDNIGVLALEESVGRTAWGVVAVEANLPLAIKEERVGVSEVDIKGWYDATMGLDRMFSLDHFGSTSEAELLSRVLYMIKGLECKWIILDHLSIVVSAMEDMGDERKAIDRIMTKLRQLVEETGVGLHLVSHLRRAGGDRGHEQGLEVSLSHLRGSQAIAQLSDVVIAAERNQQAVDEKEANLTRIRVLKNRYAGLTGLATNLCYEHATGRLKEISDVEEYLAPTVEEAGV